MKSHTIASDKMDSTANLLELDINPKIKTF